MVMSGQHNVLAVDIYKQVIGQLNFAMDAEVGMAWLISAVIAFLADRLMQRKQVALPSARAVPLISNSNRRFDRIMLIFCSLVGLCLLSILLTCNSRFAHFSGGW
jgi:iron(III) transport system permease protein